ncbi:unnamed protein product [Amoebophrya sp. A25]|nr:unnamed protein product [Amoebophrya sp. A25]|eukprot:GSA25T00022990001.1
MDDSANPTSDVTTRTGSSTAVVPSSSTTLPARPLSFDERIASMNAIWLRQYLLLTILAFALIAFTRFSFAFVCTRAGKALFNDMLHSVLRAPTHWFDQTPLGRITSRFSFDTENLDIVLLSKVYPATVCVSWVLGALVMMTNECCAFALILLPMFVGGSLFLLRTARVGILQMQRLDNNSRSPIASLTAETLQGRLVIQVFKRQGDYMRRLSSLLDDNTRAMCAFNLASRWLGVRIEITVASNTFLVICGCLWLDLPPEAFGYALVWCNCLAIAMAFLSINISAAEAAFTSVERVAEYSKLEKDGLHMEMDRGEGGGSALALYRTGSSQVNVKRLMMCSKYK